jgi:hypothetical protein
MVTGISSSGDDPVKKGYMPRVPSLLKFREIRLSE